MVFAPVIVVQLVPEPLYCQTRFVPPEFLASMKRLAPVETILVTLVTVPVTGVQFEPAPEYCQT